MHRPAEGLLKRAFRRAAALAIGRGPGPCPSSIVLNLAQLRRNVERQLRQEGYSRSVAKLAAADTVLCPGPDLITR